MAEEPVSRETGTEWASVAERGSLFAIRLIVGLVRTVGTRSLGWLLAPIAFYFSLFASSARTASTDYLRRIRRSKGDDSEPGFLDSYRHIHAFSTNLLDSLALWSSAMDDFDVEIHGREHMMPLIEAKTGAMLVGAHLGNFDVLRVLAREADIPVNVLMYSVNAEQINRAFEALDPNSKVRIISLGSQSVNTSLEIRRCIDRGEFVAVLADRLNPTARERVGYATFLGEPAAFPKGPLLLASLLRIPVIMTVALRRGPGQYDLHLHTLADGSPVPPSERPKVIQQQLEDYARLLEKYCLEAPLQWFNFYDFWAKAENDRS